LKSDIIILPAIHKQHSIKIPSGKKQWSVFAFVCIVKILFAINKIIGSGEGLKIHFGQIFLLTGSFVLSLSPDGGTE
jgi:hypothetical protein